MYYKISMSRDGRIVAHFLAVLFFLSGLCLACWLIESGPQPRGLTVCSIALLAFLGLAWVVTGILVALATLTEIRCWLNEVKERYYQLREKRYAKLIEFSNPKPDSNCPNCHGTGTNNMYSPSRPCTHCYKIRTI